MKMRIFAVVIACVAVMSVVNTAFGHRLDEYLQATTIGLSAERVVVRVRLTAGVIAAKQVIALIDRNNDGAISDGERQAYAEQVRKDLSLDIDGVNAQLTLTSLSFPTEQSIHEGLGDIVLLFEAAVPSRSANRRMSFENHHQPAMAAYLVNTLVPDDSTVHILGQNRTRDQSSYQLDFSIGNSTSVASASAIDSSAVRNTFTHGDDTAMVRTYFWYGVHHILSGFDHLLFLAALVLGAATLWDLVKVVSAFTIAHSMTLTLAALGLVHVPSGVVEPLIAGSIVFVAVQNVFWPGQSHGRSRLFVAFAFGLFHGLGFAGGLLVTMHAMPPTMILLAIAGFSLGVEGGNQLVLMPLYGILTFARRYLRPAPVRSNRLSELQRLGSAAVSVAGLYYLCVALAGISRT